MPKLSPGQRSVLERFASGEHIQAESLDARLLAAMRRKGLVEVNAGKAELTPAGTAGVAALRRKLRGDTAKDEPSHVKTKRSNGNVAAGSNGNGHAKANGNGHATAGAPPAPPVTSRAEILAAIERGAMLAVAAALADAGPNPADSESMT